MQEKPMNPALVTNASDLEAEGRPQEVEPKPQQQNASPRDIHGVKVREARSGPYIRCHIGPRPDLLHSK